MTLNRRYFNRDSDGAVRIILSITGGEKEALLKVLDEVENNAEHILSAFIETHLRGADGVLTDLKLSFGEAEALREIVAEVTGSQVWPDVDVNLVCVLDMIDRRFDLLEASR